MSTAIVLELSESEALELAECENVIAKGIDTFYEVGCALLKIRDARLYRASDETFEEYCRNRWQLSRSRAYQLIDSANVARNLSTIVDKPANEAQAREIAKLHLPDDQRLAWEFVINSATKKPNGEPVITAAHIASVVEVVREMRDTGALDDGTGEMLVVSDIVKAQITEETYERMKRQEEHIKEKLLEKHQLINSSQSNEWYTPKEYIEAARNVLGKIDLDPASSDKANQVVRAKKFFNKGNDGLGAEWRGRVFLNPPYGLEAGESNQGRWSRKLIEEYTQGRCAEAILLVNAVPGEQWFRPLWNYPICFCNHRIKFYNEQGTQEHPTHSNAFVYMGVNKDKFASVFSRFGVIAVRYGREVQS